MSNAEILVEVEETDYYMKCFGMAVRAFAFHGNGPRSILVRRTSPMALHGVA